MILSNTIFTVALLAWASPILAAPVDNQNQEQSKAAKLSCPISGQGGSKGFDCLNIPHNPQQTDRTPNNHAAWGCPSLPPYSNPETQKPHDGYPDVYPPHDDDFGKHDGPPNADPHKPEQKPGNDPYPGKPDEEVPEQKPGNDPYPGKPDEKAPEKEPGDDKSPDGAPIQTQPPHSGELICEQHRDNYGLEGNTWMQTALCWQRQGDWVLLFLKVISAQYKSGAIWYSASSTYGMQYKIEGSIGSSESQHAVEHQGIFNHPGMQQFTRFHSKQTRRLYLNGKLTAMGPYSYGAQQVNVVDYNWSAVV